MKITVLANSFANVRVVTKAKHARKVVITENHRRSQDFVWGALFLAKKLTTFF